MLTNQGYIKRVDPEEFRTIKRGGVGVKGMRTKEEEIIDIILHTNTHTDVLFFTSKGKYIVNAVIKSRNIVVKGKAYQSLIF